MDIALAEANFSKNKSYQQVRHRGRSAKLRASKGGRWNQDNNINIPKNHRSWTTAGKSRLERLRSQIVDKLQPHNTTGTSIIYPVSEAIFCRKHSQNEHADAL